jgi:hypothetical protein
MSPLQKIGKMIFNAFLPLTLKGEAIENQHSLQGKGQMLIFKFWNIDFLDQIH